MWRRGAVHLHRAAAASTASASSRVAPCLGAATAACSSSAPRSSCTGNTGPFRRAFHSTPPQRSADQDHYRVLGVTAKSSKDEIKKAYYKLAKQYHPDTSTSSNTKSSTEQFTKIQNAYEVLGDDKAKKQYDRDSNPSSAYSAYSSANTSSYANYTGFRPDEQYTFHAWQTRSSPRSATSRAKPKAADPWDDFMEDEDGDEDMSEEDLFSDLFGDQGFRQPPPSSKKKASSKTKKKASSSSARESETDSYFRSGSAPRTPKAKRSVKGADVTIDVPLSFLEAAQGVSKHLEFQADGSCKTCRGSGVSSTGHLPNCRSCNGRGVQNLKMPGHISMHITCERCDGSGVYEASCAPCSGSGLIKEKRSVRVNIPPGVESATSIRVVNQGHAGKRGGSNGHLLLKAVVAQHPLFTRQGFDLHCEYPLPLTTALLGGTAQVPTLDGGVMSIRIEQGTQHFATKTVPGRGIRVLQSKSADGAAASNGSRAQHGAMQIKWKVDLPTTLSPKAKDLLKQLALEQGNIHNVDLSQDIRRHAGKGKDADIEPEVEPVTTTVEVDAEPIFTAEATAATASSTAASSSSSSSFATADADVDVDDATADLPKKRRKVPAMEEPTRRRGRPRKVQQRAHSMA